MLLHNFPFDVQDLQIDVHYHTAGGKNNEPSGDKSIDLKKSRIHVHEKCFMSPEFALKKV